MSRAWHWRFAIIGVVCYLFFLAFYLPAPLAYSWFKPQVQAQGAELYGVEGRIWQGTADQLHIDGQVLNDVRWEFNALPLLTGTVSADVGFRNDTSFATGTVNRSLSGDIVVQNVNAKIPAAEILKIAKIPAIKLEGVFSAKLSEVAISDNALTKAEGRVAWHDAATQFPQPLTLGNLAADIRTLDSGIQVDLQDGGGPLLLAGGLTLSPVGEYNLNVKLSAADGANSALGRALSFVGRPDGQGQIPVTQKGKLSDFGFLLN